MEAIRDTREVSASLDRVWEVVSDVDNDPKYWPGLSSIKNISKNGNVIEREAVVGFRNSVSNQKVVLNPKKSIEMTIKTGPLIGTKIIRLDPSGDNKTKIDVSWNIEKWNVPFIGKSIIQNQIKKSTAEALGEIAKAVE